MTQAMQIVEQSAASLDDCATGRSLWYHQSCHSVIFCLRVLQKASSRPNAFALKQREELEVAWPELLAEVPSARGHSAA